MSSPPPTTQASAGSSAVTQTSSLYERFLAFRDDVLRHKWLKSEEAGEDIGFEAALVDYMEHHLEDDSDERATD